MSTPLGHLSTPLKPPPTTSHDVLTPGPPASGPLSPGRTSSSLPDLQLLDLKLLDLQLMDLVPYGSAIAGWPSKIENGYGQTSTKPAPLLHSVRTISGQDFKCNHCEHSFNNHKGLKMHNGKTSKSLIYPRKGHSTSVLEKIKS